MVNIVERFREKNTSKPPKTLVDTYFVLLGKIEETKKNKDFDAMLMNCQLSLSLIEPLINETKREFGAFDIKSIPAIELGLIFHAINGDEGQLLNIKEVVEYFPELQPWKKNIDEAFLMKDLTSKMAAYIKSNEGCLQKDLKKILGVEDGGMLSRIAHYMESTGKLERKKSGNTYSLFAK